MTSEVVPVTPDETRGVDLDAIMARADAATAGPWGFANEHGNWPTAEPAWCVSRYADPLTERKWLYDIAYMTGTNDEADAEFIAHAYQDIRSLVAEVRVLRDQLDKALAIHRKGDPIRILSFDPDQDGIGSRESFRCAGCSSGTGLDAHLVEWPCPTVAALTGKDTE